METSRKAGECLVICPPTETPLQGTPSSEKADRLRSIVSLLLSEIKALETSAENQNSTTQCELLKPIRKEIPMHLGSVLGTNTVSAHQVVGYLEIPNELLLESTEFLIKVPQAPEEECKPR